MIHDDAGCDAPRHGTQRDAHRRYLRRTIGPKLKMAFPHHGLRVELDDLLVERLCRLILDQAKQTFEFCWQRACNHTGANSVAVKPHSQLRIDALLVDGRPERLIQVLIAEGNSNGEDLQHGAIHRELRSGERHALIHLRKPPAACGRNEQRAAENRQQRRS